MKGQQHATNFKVKTHITEEQQNCNNRSLDSE